LLLYLPSFPPRIRHFKEGTRQFAQPRLTEFLEGEGGGVRRAENEDVEKIYNGLFGTHFMLICFLQLVIKVFNDEDPTSKTILVDQGWTAWDVCKKMIIKYDREASTNWVLEERQPGNQLRM
jgi:hypothetical protein